MYHTVKFTESKRYDIYSIKLNNMDKNKILINELPTNNVINLKVPSEVAPW